MVQFCASLPIYALPGMRAANARLWAAIAGRLADVAGVPDRLSDDDGLPTAHIGPETLFTQVCGYPLQTIHRGQGVVLGVPDYDAPGCGAPEIAGPSHRAFFVVRADDAARDLSDLRGRVFACNSRHSNTGMNLPRRSLADIAGGRPIFSRVVLTGSHAASMAAVVAGAADSASIDNLTFAFHADHDPAALAGLRVLAETVPSPAIPFVTSIATAPAAVAALHRALADVGAHRDLRLRGIAAPAASDYTVLSRYEAEAAAVGYSELA